MYINVINKNASDYYYYIYDLDTVKDNIEFDNSIHLFQIAITSNDISSMCKCKGGEYSCYCFPYPSRNGKLLFWLDKYRKILKCDKDIILSDVYDIFDVRTLIKFYKYINITESYVDAVCGFGKVDTLDLLMRKFGSELKYSKNALDNASGNGHVNVLNYWKNSGLELKYSAIALNNASGRGHIEILEWWVKSNLPLKYDIGVIKGASGNGHIDVLEWWLKSGLCIPIMYYSGDLTLKYSEIIADTASIYGCVNVLEWWKNSGLPLEYTTTAIDNGCVNALEWWKNSGLPLKYTNIPIQRATLYGDIDALEWWKNSGLPLKYNIHYILHGSIRCKDDHEKSIKWWKNSGLPYDPNICLSIVDGKVVLNN
jgi:hypothetical protein